MVAAKPNPKSEPPGWASFQLQWLKQIALHAALTPFAVRVAVRLLNYVNRERREAWPTAETLANDLGATKTGIHKALASLEREGFLSVSHRRGRHVSNLYRPILPDEKRTTAVVLFDAEKDNRQRQKGQPPFPKRTTVVAAEPKEEPKEEPLSASEQEKGLFEKVRSELWRIMPPAMVSRSKPGPVIEQLSALSVEIDLTHLTRAARKFADNPEALQGRDFPPSVQSWLADLQFERYMPTASEIAREAFSESELKWLFKLWKLAKLDAWDSFADGPRPGQAECRCPPHLLNVDLEPLYSDGGPSRRPRRYDAEYC